MSQAKHSLLKRTSNSASILAALLLILIDQGIKTVIREYPADAVIWRFPPFLELRPCSNTGAAFSILSGHPVIIIAASLLILAALLIGVSRYMTLSPAGRLFIAVLVAGAAGNLIDRLVYGFVTDYIRLLFIRFPVFNFADILITCSAAGLMFLLLTDKLEISRTSTE